MTSKEAAAVLDGTVMKPSAMLAYNDSWLLILLSFLCVIPAVFLLHKPKGRLEGVDAH